MRKIKIIKLDEREVTVKELRVKDIKEVFNEKSKKTLLDHLPMVTDLATSDIEELAPSELSILWDAVKEVNADFLALMERTGIMEKMEKTAMLLLTELSVSSSSPVTPASGNMGTASS
jgi:hypothetical protein